MDLSVITLVHSMAFVGFLLFHIFYASFTLRLNREFYCDKLVPEQCTFLVITQRVVVIPYCRSRTIYRYLLQWSIIQGLNWILDL